MKKYSIFVLVLVLTAATLVGCGCTNQDMGSSAPTVLPTNEEVHPTTRETSAPTTAPTTETSSEPSAPTQTQETIDRGNGPIEDTTTESTGSGTGAGAADSARGIMNGNGSAGRGTSRG